MASTREQRMDTISSASGSAITLEPSGTVINGGASNDKDFVGANIKKNNLTSSVAPGINDDSLAGYAQGSLWIDQATGNIYSCSDASAGAAQWVLNNATGGGGGGNLSVRSVSTTGNVLLTDDLLLCDATGGAFTLTLPTASGNDGKVFEFFKNDTVFTQVTIDGNGAETIGGSTTTTIDTEAENLKIVSDGTNWQILDRRIPFDWKDTGELITIQATTTNPTKASNLETDEMFWARKGNKLCVQVNYRSDTTTTGAAAGTGDYLFSIPFASDLTIDTTLVAGGAITSNVQPVSPVELDWRKFGVLNSTADGAGSVSSGGAIVYDTTRYRIVYFDTGNNFRAFGNVNLGDCTRVNNGWNLQIEFPITEWNA